ncbi:MAG: transposase [Desulfosudaceae bacterium]
MAWADYRKNFKKARLHMGFCIDKGIASKPHLTAGNGSKSPLVSQIRDPGQSGACDRGYQDHTLFDPLQAEGKHFVIRIKAKTIKTTLAHKRPFVLSLIAWQGSIIGLLPITGI